MISTESIGYGIDGKIAGDVDSSTGNTMASKAFSTGASLAGVPSLVQSGGSIMKSLEVLGNGKKKKKLF